MARRRDESKRKEDYTIVDIPEDAIVRITNDYNGRYVLKHQALTQYKIELSKAGSGVTSEQWITFKELRAVKNTYLRAFESLIIMITGVKDATKTISYTDNEGKKKTKKVPIEIKDVVRALGLSQYYESHAQMIPTKNNIETPDGYDIEDFIMESEVSDFEKTMKEAPSSLKFKIADAAAGLYFSGDFANRIKMDIIENTMGSEFFNAIDFAKAYKNGIIQKSGITTW